MSHLSCLIEDARKYSRLIEFYTSGAITLNEDFVLNKEDVETILCDIFELSLDLRNALSVLDKRENDEKKQNEERIKS